MNITAKLLLLITTQKNERCTRQLLLIRTLAPSLTLIADRDIAYYTVESGEWKVESLQLRVKSKVKRGEEKYEESYLYGFVFTVYTVNNISTVISYCHIIVTNYTVLNTTVPMIIWSISLSLCEASSICQACAGSRELGSLRNCSIHIKAPEHVCLLKSLVVTCSW